MTKNEAIEKIKKCLALSASSNEHEAEAALRQARALMEKYGVENADVLASQASEQHAKASAERKPAKWETFLANKVSDAFGCQLIFEIDFWRGSKWTFIGVGAAPEIASYAFEVLLRQCKRHRADHIKQKLKRCKTSTKTRRADLFCEGWVQVVAGKITSFAGTDDQANAIEAYIGKNYPSLGNLKSRDRNDKRGLREHELNDYHLGRQRGRDAELNRGVGGEQQQRLE